VAGQVLIGPAAGEKPVGVAVLSVLLLEQI